MLETVDLDAGYGEIRVLEAVSLTVDAGEVLAVVGPNGAGKTTLLRTIAGFVEPTNGTIRYRGADVTATGASERVRRGISLVPEERNLFRDMTVKENLRLGSYTARDDRDEHLERVYDLFPKLRERSSQRAGTLSGGEAQMLTIGRSLMTDPDLLLLDEPSLGLAPKLLPELFEKVGRINAEEGITVILVEQQMDRALEVADTGCLFESGRVVTRDDADQLLADEHVVEQYLGGA